MAGPEGHLRLWVWPFRETTRALGSTLVCVLANLLFGSSSLHLIGADWLVPGGGGRYKERLSAFSFLLVCVCVCVCVGGTDCCGALLSRDHPASLSVYWINSINSHLAGIGWRDVPPPAPLSHAPPLLPLWALDQLISDFPHSTCSSGFFFLYRAKGARVELLWVLNGCAR